MIFLNAAYNQYVLFQDLRSYSVLCVLSELWSYVTRILVIHFVIYHTSIMDEGGVLSLQKTLQSVPRRRPVIVLQRVEERFPALKENVVSALCICAYKTVLSCVH